MILCKNTFIFPFTQISPLLIYHKGIFKDKQMIFSSISRDIEKDFVILQL